ncbi:hypothetical protein MRX96_053724, partial [Rhipicephalus microplus]
VGFYIGDPCKQTCSSVLDHVFCNHTSRRCECRPEYPVNINNRQCVRGTTCSNGIRRHDSTDGSDGVWASRRVASRKSTRNRLCDVSPSGNCIAHGRSSCLRLAGPAQCRRRATCSRTFNSAS